MWYMLKEPRGVVPNTTFLDWHITCTPCLSCLFTPDPYSAWASSFLRANTPSSAFHILRTSFCCQYHLWTISLLSLFIFSTQPYQNQCWPWNHRFVGLYLFICIEIKIPIIKIYEAYFCAIWILSHVSTRNTVLACFCTLSRFDEHCAIMGGVGINSLCTSCIKPYF